MATSSSSGGPPQHIIDFIESQTLRSIGSIEECRSAQQNVWIVTLNEAEEEDVEVETASNSTIDDKLSHDDTQYRLLLWKDCLRMGQNRNSSPHALAEKELEGYQVSYAALKDATTTRVPVVIPRILHSQINATSLQYPQSDNDSITHNNYNDDPWPWAILENVGPHSLYFLGKDTARGNSYDYDPTWVERMVKVRHEFGFQEPHPRWGRVPVSQALQYAVQVLDQFIIPLHLSGHHNHPQQQHPKLTDGHTYDSMVTLYQQTYQELLTATVAAKNYHQHQKFDEMVVRQEDCQRWDQVLALIKEAVYQILPSNASEIQVLQPPFPTMVLVHLDLQPQNLLLARRQQRQRHHQHQYLDPCNDEEENEIVIVSVLDWEDAAMADPRFEILLLGRKVCANRAQAEQIWKRYADKICSTTTSTHNDDRNNKTLSLRFLSPEARLGPLKPWLQLETVHSLLTMLSQSMDLLNGGRNPWESSKDLWGKIEREMTRWQDMLVESTISTLETTINEPVKEDVVRGEALPETLSSTSHLETEDFVSRI